MYNYFIILNLQKSPNDCKIYKKRILEKMWNYLPNSPILEKTAEHIGGVR